MRVARAYAGGMSSLSGRPRASSREVLAEAACELFLENGYETTSIADITQRAGVSRSSFFNYFDSKAALLWSGFDERLARLDVVLNADDEADATSAVRRALVEMSSDFAPDSLALAMANAEAMGIAEELDRETSTRRSRIARAVSRRFRRGGTESLRAEVIGAAYAGAVLAAMQCWAESGPGHTELGAVLNRALDEVAALHSTRVAGSSGGDVRQLRLVVHAEDFDRTLVFYRDVLGMPQAEAYEAGGGARVVILDAGRATVELANSAQVRFIDEVETDGIASDRLRVAFEVADAAAAAARAVGGGARLEASARRTPWRSVNARLRAPADLQVTLFEELESRDSGS